MSNLNDTGKREYYENGSMREPSDGKGRYDLISPHMTKRLAIHYENGANKYEEGNWEKGLSSKRCISSAKRHIDKYILGMDDEDHLSAAIWNLACIIHYEECNPSIIDLPNRPEYKLYLESKDRKDVIETLKEEVSNKIGDINKMNNVKSTEKVFKCNIAEYIEIISKDSDISTVVNGIPEELLKVNHIDIDRIMTLVAQTDTELDIPLTIKYISCCRYILINRIPYDMIKYIKIIVQHVGFHKNQFIVRNLSIVLIALLQDLDPIVNILLREDLGDDMFTSVATLKHCEVKTECFIGDSDSIYDDFIESLKIPYNRDTNNVFKNIPDELRLTVDTSLHDILNRPEDDITVIDILSVIMKLHFIIMANKDDLAIKCDLQGDILGNLAKVLKNINNMTDDNTRDNIFIVLYMFLFSLFGSVSAILHYELITNFKHLKPVINEIRNGISDKDEITKSSNDNTTNINEVKKEESKIKESEYDISLLFNPTLKSDKGDSISKIETDMLLLHETCVRDGINRLACGLPDNYRNQLKDEILLIKDISPIELRCSAMYMVYYQLCNIHLDIRNIFKECSDDIDKKIRGEIEEFPSCLKYPYHQKYNNIVNKIPKNFYKTELDINFVISILKNNITYENIIISIIKCMEVTHSHVGCGNTTITSDMVIKSLKDVLNIIRSEKDKVTRDNLFIITCRMIYGIYPILDDILDREHSELYNHIDISTFK